MNYFVKLLNDKLIAFYYSNKSIYYKTHDGMQFKSEALLVEDVLDNFTVCLAYDDTVYLFCQNINGDVLLCTKNNNDISSRMILKNTANTIVKVNFNALVSDNAFSLIYNSESHLILQQLDSSGKWQPAAPIDKYISLPNTAYTVQNISCEHLLAFYRTPENHLVYREINTEQFGSPNIFHTTTHKIVDTSFLVMADCVHMLFIVRNMFSCQILYRKKDSSDFSNIKILWEAPNISNCLLFEIEGKLYVTFSMKGHLYMMFSENNGNTFSHIIKYKDQFGVNVKKAKYVSANQVKDHCLHEIYVSAEDPCDILLIPEIFPDFFKFTSVNRTPKPPIASNNFRAASVRPPQNNDQDRPQINIENEAFNRLQSQYNLAVQQNSEKERQISEYVSVLENTKNKISELNSTWQTKYDLLARELSELKENAVKREIKIEKESEMQVESRSESETDSDTNLL